MHRVSEAITTVPWLITEPWLRTIIQIASRDGLGVEAVEAKLGRQLDNTRRVTERDGVAIIPVTGPIFRYANLFTEISGATSVQMLARDLVAAVENPAINRIVLNVDSPGGEANGINEISDLIYQAAEKKPIDCYVGGICASAAYWIASACDSIAVDETAFLGSVGVVLLVREPKDDPYKTLEIVSAQSPRKRLDPWSDEGKGELQKIADDLAAVFVAKVARNRGVDEKFVMQNFGGGSLLMGKDAVLAQMADDITSFEAFLATLSGGAAGSTTNVGGAEMARKRKLAEPEAEIVKRSILAAEDEDEKKPDTEQDEEKDEETKKAEDDDEKKDEPETKAEEDDDEEVDTEDDDEDDDPLMESDEEKDEETKKAEDDDEKKDDEEVSALRASLFISQFRSKLSDRTLGQFAALAAGLNGRQFQALCAAVDSLPGPTAIGGAKLDVRAGIKSDAVVAKIAGEDGVHWATLDRLEREGVRQGSPQWSRRYKQVYREIQSPK